MVHRDIISAKSPFFEAACSKRWKEGLEKTIRMPEAESEVFRAYITWIYSNNIDVARVETTNKRALDDQKLLMSLYIFGDFAGDRPLCRESIRLLVSLSKIWRVVFTTRPFLAKVWASTMPSSPSRKVVVDRIILFLNAENVASHIDRHPAEVAREIAMALMRQRDTNSTKSFVARLDEYLEAEDKRP